MHLFKFEGNIPFCFCPSLFPLLSLFCDTQGTADPDHYDELVNIDDEREQ